MTTMPVSNESVSEARAATTCTCTVYQAIHVPSLTRWLVGAHGEAELALRRVNQLDGVFDHRRVLHP